ncbi:hypothetical protein GCM10027418_08510 [Mariniluteicoccus endophyticus]
MRQVLTEARIQQVSQATVQQMTEVARQHLSNGAGAPPFPPTSGG